MTEVDTDLPKLSYEHPEWGPWLAVVGAILRENVHPQWDAVVPPCAPTRANKRPLLADATINLPRSLAQPMFDRLIRVASESGAPKLATLAHMELDVFSVFNASLRLESDRLKEMAIARGVDCEAFEAVTSLLPLPLLHACNRRWAGAAVAEWSEGYCPICGAWPAFAEVRGIERSRYLRCGRCAAAWQAQCLVCPYCGTTDHEKLVSLVSDGSASNSVIDACKHCLGYLKIFTKLQGTLPANVILNDLASVELDVAAAAQGYQRPQGAGYLIKAITRDNGEPGDRLAQRDERN